MQTQEQTHHQNFYIDGDWSKPATSNRIDVIGANTGLVIGIVPGAFVNLSQAAAMFFGI